MVFGGMVFGRLCLPKFFRKGDFSGALPSSFSVREIFGRRCLPKFFRKEILVPPAGEIPQVFP